MPSSITVLALCAGLTGIQLALLGQWRNAVLAIMVAALLDASDGRLARMLGSSTRFGADLDSLSAVISFGVAPPVIQIGRASFRERVGQCELISGVAVSVQKKK